MARTGLQASSAIFAVPSHERADSIRSAGVYGLHAIENRSGATKSRFRRI
jgi:hypothetical protein